MVAAYLRERFDLRLYIPLAVAIGAPSWFPPSGGSPLAAGAFAFLLLLQFRAWDDLADRSHDAVRHPHRVLVRATEVTPVIAFCLAVAVVNVCIAVWRDATGLAVAILAALNAVFAAWYLARSGRTAVGDHLLLAKYPAMVAIVAGERALAAPIPVLASAAVLYVAACGYEAWHDRSSPLARYLSFGGR